MKFNFKSVIALWIVLLLIIGGLLYNAYSKLRPDTFIALLTEQVQKNYPGTELVVGKVSYRFSLDFNLHLEEIHARRAGKLLGSIGEVELKVPWWLLLTHRGNAQINLSNLDIYVDHEITEDSAEEAAEAVSSASKSIQVTLPEYLVDAKFTLRAKNISVKDINNARRYFTLSKILVREFQYGKNSAFELNIPISISHNETHLTSDLWLFGDVTPEAQEWKLNFRGEFRTKESSDKFQIDDLVIDGSASFAPSSFNIRSDLSLLVDKDKIGTGQLTANEEKLNLTMSFGRLPLNYFSFIYEEIKNPYLENLEGEAFGSIKFDKVFKNELASVTGKLTFDGALFLSKEFSPVGKWALNFVDSKWDMSFMSPKGEASFFRRFVVDMKKNVVTQYVEELGFSGLDLAQTIKPIISLSKFAKDQNTSYYNSTVSYKKCKLNDQYYDGNFKYGSSPDQKFFQGELIHANTDLKFSYLDRSSVHSLEVTANQFQWNEAFKFFSPYLDMKQGLVNGKIQGKWSEDWEAGEWLMQMDYQNLEGAQGTVPDFITKTGSFFEVNAANSKQQNHQISVKNNLITINSLMLTGTEPVKVTGTLSKKQKSFLTATFPKSKKPKVKKEIIEPYWTQKEEL